MRSININSLFGSSSSDPISKVVPGECGLGYSDDRLQLVTADQSGETYQVPAHHIDQPKALEGLPEDVIATFLTVAALPKGQHLAAPLLEKARKSIEGSIERAAAQTVIRKGNVDLDAETARVLKQLERAERTGKVSKLSESCQLMRDRQYVITRALIVLDRLAHWAGTGASIPEGYLFLNNSQALLDLLTFTGAAVLAPENSSSAYWDQRLAKRQPVTVVPGWFPVSRNSALRDRWAPELGPKVVALMDAVSDNTARLNTTWRKPDLVVGGSTIRALSESRAKRQEEVRDDS